MLPELQKGQPTWPELRSMGVGWWLRSTNKLRRCIEKVLTRLIIYNNLSALNSKTKDGFSYLPLLSNSKMF